ncbi:MAG: hypothetical protein H7301_04215 [Cryobacterium sp.]|nr:hypothetical protein [Oligoflexia bacterium]
MFYLNAVKSSLFLSIVLTSVASASASNLVPGTYSCGYPDDANRGISVARSTLRIEETGRGFVACLDFLGNSSGGRAVVGTSCGNYSESYGVRENTYGIPSAWFHGFEDFTEESHISLPPAEDRFAVIEFEGESPCVFIRGDHRSNPDLTYECVSEE